MPRSESIYLYRLAPARMMIDLAPDLFREVLGADRMRSGDVEARAIPTCGFLTFTDSGRAWRNDDPDRLPRDEMEAERAARSWLERLNRAFGRLRPREGTLPPRLLPEDVRVSTVAPVLAVNSDAIDHWLVGFVLHLPTGARPVASTAPAAPPNAPVRFAPLDVRVGAGGEIIGLRCNWRPIVGFEAIDRLPMPPVESDAPPTETFYLMHEEDEDRELLAPYDQLRGETIDTFGPRPASARSEPIDVDPVDYQQSLDEA